MIADRMTELTKAVEAMETAEGVARKAREKVAQVMRETFADGMSQGEIARSVGLTQGRVSQIIHGRR